MKLNNRLGQYLIAMLIVLYCTTNVVHALNRVQKDRVRKATVFIETENGIGTGFYISDNEVATCLHLVAGANKITVKTISENEKEKDLNYIGLGLYDETDNLAILRVEESNSKHLEISTDPVHGEEILAVGYDENRKFQIEDSNITHSSEKFCHTGIRFPITISSDGGLVLDLHAKVKGIFFIGMLEFTHELAELNYSFVVPANRLKALLEEPWSFTPPKSVVLEFDHCKLIRQGNAKLRKSKWLKKTNKRTRNFVVRYFNSGKSTVIDGAEKFLNYKNIPPERIRQAREILEKIIKIL